jgi:hypothetical protein
LALRHGFIRFNAPLSSSTHAYTHTQREKWYGHLFRRPTTLFVFWFTLAPKLGQRCHRFAFSFFFPPDGFYFWFLLPLHPPCRYSIPDYFSCVFQGVHLISSSLTGFAGVPIKREYTRARSFSFGQKREFHNEDLRRWWASWSVRLLGRWGHYRFLPRCVCVLCVCEGVPLCSERWSCEGLLPSSNLCGTAGHGRARLDWRVEVDEYFQPQRWVRVFFPPFFFGEARVLSIVCVALRVFVVCAPCMRARLSVCLSLSSPSLCCVTLQVGEVIISLLKIDILCVQESIYLSALLHHYTPCRSGK